MFQKFKTQEGVFNIHLNIHKMTNNVIVPFPLEEAKIKTLDLQLISIFEKMTVTEMKAILVSRQFREAAAISRKAELTVSPRVFPATQE